MATSSPNNYEDQDIRLQLHSKLGGLVRDINSKLRNKYNIYQNIKSKELEQQLDRIDKLKSAVDTKTSLVSKLDHESQIKDLYIQLTWYFVYVIIFVVVFPWLFYMGGWLSFRPFIYIILIAIISYFAYVAYKLNSFFFKSRGPTTEAEAVRLGKELGNAIYKEGRRLERDARNFIYENCDCPSDDKKKKPKKDKHAKTPPLPFSIGGGVSIDDPDLRGYYYSDSGTPLEKIVPKIDDEEAKKDTTPDRYFKIDWTGGTRILSKADQKFCDSLPLNEKCKVEVCCPLPKAHDRKARFDSSAACSADYDYDYDDTTAKYKPFSRGGTWTMGL